MNRKQSVNYKQDMCDCRLPLKSRW